MQPALTQIITSSSGAVTGIRCQCIQAIADAVISTCTGTLSGFAGVTIPAGSFIYCTLTAITLTSGTMVLYKDAP